MPPTWSTASYRAAMSEKAVDRHLLPGQRRGLFGRRSLRVAGRGHRRARAHEGHSRPGGQDARAVCRFGVARACTKTCLLNRDRLTTSVVSRAGSATYRGRGAIWAISRGFRCRPGSETRINGIAANTGCDVSAGRRRRREPALLAYSLARPRWCSPPPSGLASLPERTAGRSTPRPSYWP